MNRNIKSALQSVRIFAYDRRIHSLTGRFLPGELLTVDAPPDELRAVANKIVSRRPLWRSVREELLKRANELEARAKRDPGPMCRPNVTFLYSPWG